MDGSCGKTYCLDDTNKTRHVGVVMLLDHAQYETEEKWWDCEVRYKAGLAIGDLLWGGAEHIWYSY